MWFKFTDDFNWRASPRGFRQFLKGQKVNVPAACAEEAEAKGKGHPADKDGKSTKAEPETTEVFVKDDETPAKKQSLMGKLTGTADREPG